MSVPDVALSRAPIAHAFLALGDQPVRAAPPGRRSRLVAGAAVVALALAAPLTTAGLALTAADRHDAATLPGKTWIAADDEDAGAGG
jgi:hypothetical protein